MLFHLNCQRKSVLAEEISLSCTRAHAHMTRTYITHHSEPQRFVTHIQISSVGNNGILHTF
jgi:hypothetical protein